LATTDIVDIEKGQKMENAKLTKAEAVAKMTEWANYLEVPTEGEDWDAAIETLAIPIMNGRLDFSEDDETFTLVLKAPIEFDGGGKKEMITIRETTMNDKRVAERYKENEKISQVEAIYAKSCDLKLGEASRLKGRDISVITAVNQVFFS
jgi:hypothetical protein